MILSNKRITKALTRLRGCRSQTSEDMFSRVEAKILQNVRACILVNGTVISLWVQLLSGSVLDSRPRGCGLEPHRSHCVVSLKSLLSTGSYQELPFRHN